MGRPVDTAGGRRRLPLRHVALRRDAPGAGLALPHPSRGLSKRSATAPGHDGGRARGVLARADSPAEAAAGRVPGRPCPDGRMGLVGERRERPTRPRSADEPVRRDAVLARRLGLLGGCRRRAPAPPPGRPDDGCCIPGPDERRRRDDANHYVLDALAGAAVVVVTASVPLLYRRCLCTSAGPRAVPARAVVAAAGRDMVHAAP